MKVIGIIPARYGSSRFPGKPLIDLKGKTMIQRVYEGASLSKKLDKIIVATDDQRIVDAVQSFGGHVVLTSENHTTGTDRCGEVIQNESCDVVINIQGDEPLVDARQIDQLITAFEDDRTEIATLGTYNFDLEDLNNPNRIKIVKGQDDFALYFSRSAVPNNVNAKGEEYPFMRHIGLYGYRSKVLSKIIQLEPTQLEKVESLEQLRWLYYGYKIKVATTDIETPNIDTPEDIEKVLKHL